MLTGVAPENGLELADKRLRPVELPEGDLKALQSQALLHRPEMRQLAAGLQARREWMLAKKSNYCFTLARTMRCFWRAQSASFSVSRLS